MTTETGDRRLVTVVLVVLALLVLFPLLFGGMFVMGGGPMMGGHWGEGWGHGATAWWMVLVGVLMQVVFLVALLVAGYFVYRTLVGSSGAASGRRDPALEELRRAYARGDLSDEEYERRRETLLEGDERGERGRDRPESDRDQ